MVLARSVSRIPTRFEALYNREQARWKTIEAEITDLIPLFARFFFHQTEHQV
jgi:hypothetical protein|tara:strand:- start:3 stop:158 length:156 start_codon:yes stop_codon:yes gene_type:complete